MTNTWIIDKSHSEISFKVRHLMISTVTGQFKDFNGSVEVSDEDLSNGSFEFKASIDSIDTNNKDRDAHLKGEDFFDMENFPNLEFKSSKYENGKLYGDLSIRGTKKPIALDLDFNGIVKDAYNQTKAGFDISGEINRKDFGLNWNATTEAGGVVVSDKIRLFANLQFTKQG